jgi:hypothetical protein
MGETEIFAENLPGYLFMLCSFFSFCWIFV